MGFFGDLFGGSARKDLKRAKKASDAALQAGYDEAQPFYEEAFDLYEPYATSGQEANTRYNQLLGLGTDEEREQAQARYLSDPIFSSVLNQQSNALLRQQNARGGTYGGAAVQAAGRLGLENYGNYLNRLQGQGSQGFMAASQQSGIRQGQGDLRYGLGASKAGQETSFGNAMAQSRNIGINNLLNIAGTAAKAYTAFSDIRLKRDIERIGFLPSGLATYRFKYHWSDDEYEGVMAHEAEQMFPWAVSYDPDGFAMVDYSKIS